MLENGAKVLHYCDDRALQSHCLKHSIIIERSYSFSGHRPAILHQKSKSLATTTVCWGYSCTFKRAIVCYYSPFTRKAMIVNKQACQVLQANIEKTDTFSTSAEIF